MKNMKRVFKLEIPINLWSGMEKYILLSILSLLLLAVSASAVELEVGSTYSNTFNLVTSGVQFNSCAVLENYQFGSCNYLYKCYLILPKDCSDISCAKDYLCSDIATLANPEALTVLYTATQADIGKSYAVSTFIMNSQMTYDFGTKLWNDVTTPVDSTIQNDVITVRGAGQPPAADPLAGLVAVIQSIIAGIKSWICGAFGFWC